MQNYAKNKFNEVYSSEHALRGQDYYCIECTMPMRIRKSSKGLLHFYHKKLSSQCKHSAKSPLHLKVQNDLARQMNKQEVFLEKFFLGISRIADIYLKKMSMVIEVQCSPISYMEIEDRIQAYESLGLHVFWLFHLKTFKKQYKRLFKVCKGIQFAFFFERNKEIKYFQGDPKILFSSYSQAKSSDIAWVNWKQWIVFDPVIYKNFHLFKQEIRHFPLIFQNTLAWQMIHGQEPWSLKKQKKILRKKRKEKVRDFISQVLSTFFKIFLHPFKIIEKSFLEHASKKYSP